MAEHSLKEYTARATKEGYIIMPFVIIDAQDKALKLETLYKSLTDTLIRDFITEDLLDRLTYVREFMIRKSINFMLMAKDVRGRSVAVANFAYSKSTNLLYLKNYVLAQGAEGSEMLAFLVSGADNYLRQYGFDAKAVIASPSISKNNASSISFMRDIGMKFVFFEPKVEKPFSSSANQFASFPIKKNGKIMDRRVIMVRQYKKGTKGLNTDSLAKFLMDLEDEEELQKLFSIIDVKKFNIHIKGIRESKKLLTLLSVDFSL